MESGADWINENIVSTALGGSKIILSISVNAAVKKGEHFLSTILRADVKYKENNNDNTIHHTSIILKTLPVGFLRDFISESGMLLKEIKMYKCVIPLISNIIGKSITPRNLKSSKDDVLILEDLRLDNFTSGSRLKGLDLEQCKEAIKVLADFHGASYILNKSYPDALEFVKKEIQYTEENQIQKSFVINSFKIIANELLNWTGYEDYSIKLNNLKEKIWEVTTKEILPQDNEINVLNHGDFWINNILHRYSDTKNNKISETKIIDFQFSRWASPAIDLHHFFTISVRSRKNQPALIDTYLSKLNEHIQPSITKTTLENALRRTQCFSLLVAITVLPVLLIDSSKMIDLDKIDPATATDGIDNNPLYRIACTNVLFKEIFQDYLKYFDGTGLLN